MKELLTVVLLLLLLISISFGPVEMQGRQGSTDLNALEDSLNYYQGSIASVTAYQNGWTHEDAILYFNIPFQGKIIKVESQQEGVFEWSMEYDVPPVRHAGFRCNSPVWPAKYPSVRVLSNPQCVYTCDDDAEALADSLSVVLPNSGIWVDDEGGDELGFYSSTDGVEIHVYPSDDGIIEWEGWPISGVKQ